MEIAGYYEHRGLTSASTPRTITITVVYPDSPTDPILDAVHEVRDRDYAPDVAHLRAELAACNDALPHFTPFTPPPSPLPPLTNQPAPSDPPQRRRRHRIQARAPPATSGEYFTYPPPPKD